MVRVNLKSPFYLAFISNLIFKNNTTKIFLFAGINIFFVIIIIIYQTLIPGTRTRLQFTLIRSITALFK